MDIMAEIFADGEEGADVQPSLGDYVMHALTVPWKLVFALIPPTGMIDIYHRYFNVFYY